MKAQGWLFRGPRAEDARSRAHVRSQVPALGLEPFFQCHERRAVGAAVEVKGPVGRTRAKLHSLLLAA
jgi:hypothetical protein